MSWEARHIEFNSRHRLLSAAKICFFLCEMLLNELHQGPKQTAYGKNQRLDKKLGDAGSNPVSATVVVTPMPLRPTLASREVGMVVFTVKPLERLSS